MTKEAMLQEERQRDILMFHIKMDAIEHGGFIALDCGKGKLRKICSFIWGGKGAGLLGAGVQDGETDGMPEGWNGWIGGRFALAAA